VNTKTHLLNANGQFNGLEEVIETALSETLRKITAIMPVDNIDIIISDYPRHIIPGLGLGGVAWTAYRAELHIDTKFPNIKAQIQKRLPQTIAHELLHCIREQSLGESKTLLEAIIDDGLADQFSVEITRLEPGAWSVAVKGEKLQELLKKAKKEFGNRKYDHENWFFGRGKRDIPHWTGYSLGFYLVGEYLKKHPDAKASTLYNLPAKEFIK
jgi:uncharacterized protein YjaZ